MADTKQVKGGTALKKKLRTIQQNTKTALTNGSILKFILERNLERFRLGVDPDGVPWKPLAQSTILRKRRAQKTGNALRGSGSRILVRTGAMFKNIRILAGASIGGLGIATGFGGRIGIADPEIAEYARKHQSGRGRPRRRFLGVSLADRKAVDSLLSRAIIRKSGLR